MLRSVLKEDERRCGEEDERTYEPVEKKMNGVPWRMKWKTKRMKMKWWTGERRCGFAAVWIAMEDEEDEVMNGGTALLICYDLGFDFVDLCFVACVVWCGCVGL